MALGEPSVTLEGVQMHRSGLYQASVRLVVPDDDPDWDGINEIVSRRWNEGTPVNLWRNSVITGCQAVINKYKDEKTKATSSQLATAITQIQSNLII